YISPRFLNKLAVHITKNFLDLPGVRVPLILGIHGRKGEGKTFQCDLVFERMKVEVVQMSAGELESPDAGDPSRLIRLRYREAAELVRVRGKMAVLLINDLDAGAGRFDQGTQYTVNTQLVNGTLMNIADDPTNVQLPGSYDENPVRRVPIIVTGNDFSTLYAPLIRDGRMEKFYWAPDRRDRLGIVGGIFAPDGLSSQEIHDLVDSFPNQSIDFFSALRAQVYDEQVEQFIHDIGIESVSLRVVNSPSGPPVFPKPNFTLRHLKELGQAMVAEQQRIADMKLAREYNQHLGPTPGTQPGSETPPPSPRGKVDRPFVSPTPVSHSPKPDPTPASTADIATQSQPDSGQLAPHIATQVRNLINQGYGVGIEQADQRRYRANAWQTCALPNNRNAEEAIAHLEICLANHPNQYIRLIGINPHGKQRVSETIIHRPQ
ncbi:MAG: ribulose bisphosphate carboxylase small subunit, partial [Leptolyngbyaceae bacterium]|nr:ribulose bisphosphate carboxylase small subunit [Leptolyngbyaceae bacterium]